MSAPSAAVDKTQFASVLLQRLNAFFSDQQKSRKGDALMTFKIGFGLMLWAVTYSSFFVSGISNNLFFLLYLLHGCTHVFLLLNITHDSNHQAISSKPFINKLLSLVMDVCGINSYMWRILHHHGHHSCINVYGEDEAILGRSFFRFSPHSQRKDIYRYQHIYVFPLYLLFSLDYVLIKDIQCFFFPNYQPLKQARHAAREYLILFGGKLFYLMYMLTIPIAVLGRPSLLVLSAFAVTHGIIGMTTLMVFQSTHVIEASHFPQTRNDFDTYVEHIFATTADYSTRNRLASFLVGGLNHHIVHHLLPNVCHTHYDELTKIVRETSKEHGIAYREHETIWKAFAQHLALLKRLGRA